MVYFEDFTNDEQLIIHLSLGVEGLIGKVSELSKIDDDLVSMQIRQAIGEYIAAQSVDDLRQHLEALRLDNATAIELARKHSQDFNN